MRWRKSGNLRIRVAALALAAAVAVGTAAAQQPAPTLSDDGGGQLRALRRARDALAGARDFDAALNRLGKEHEFVEFSIFQHVEVKSGLGLGPLLGDGIRLYRVVYALLEPSI